MVRRFDLKQNHDTKRIDYHAEKDNADVANQLGITAEHTARMLKNKNSSRGKHRGKDANRHQRYGEDKNAEYFLHPGHRLKRGRINETDQPCQQRRGSFCMWHGVPLANTLFYRLAMREPKIIQATRESLGDGDLIQGMPSL